MRAQGAAIKGEVGTQWSPFGLAAKRIDDPLQIYDLDQSAVFSSEVDQSKENASKGKLQTGENKESGKGEQDYEGLDEIWFDKLKQ